MMTMVLLPPSTRLTWLWISVATTGTGNPNTSTDPPARDADDDFLAAEPASGY